jgi:hypothetical protein
MHAKEIVRYLSLVGKVFTLWDAVHIFRTSDLPGYERKQPLLCFSAKIPSQNP